MKSLADQTLPSSVAASLPISLLVSQDRLQQAVERYGSDYTTMVFTRYSTPPVSLRKAVGGGAPTFWDVTNFFSRDATLMWLRFHIAETFAFVGIYDTASKQQIMQTAELILDHEIFGQMNLSEFLIFLARFKRGDYGKIYQSARPNPQEFLGCLKPFWNELCEERIRVAQKEREAAAKAKAEAEKNIPVITYEEWQDIKEQCEMIERMYEMPAAQPQATQHTAHATTAHTTCEQKGNINN